MTIAPATTTTTAFLGALPDGGALYEAQRITSALPGTTPLAAAIGQFFLGGAREAWIVRLPATDADLQRARAALDAVPSLNLVAMPDLVTLTGLPHRRTAALIAAYCVERGAFFIVDPPGDWSTVDTIAQQIGDFAFLREHGAIYWPPLVDGTPAPMAPSGAVAAVYVACDESLGVWRAPAGVSFPLAAVDPAVAINDADNGVLNPLGVNAIRRFPNYGTVVWGARTLAVADAAYRYVSVRRLALFLEASITQGLQWTEFQANDVTLWRSVTNEVSAFMTALWRDGAFAGATPDTAFYVRCDTTTMTPEDIASGQVWVSVGFAPVHPAEFVVLQISARAQPGISA